MNKKVFYRKDYLTFKKKYSLLCNNNPVSLICLEKPKISSNFVKQIVITEIKKYGD
jgi:hypothetical protein